VLKNRGNASHTLKSKFFLKGKVKRNLWWLSPHNITMRFPMVFCLVQFRFTLETRVHGHCHGLIQRARYHEVVIGHGTSTQMSTTPYIAVRLQKQKNLYSIIWPYPLNLDISTLNYLNLNTRGQDNSRNLQFYLELWIIFNLKLSGHILNQLLVFTIHSNCDLLSSLPLMHEYLKPKISTYKLSLSFTTW
jgi:hypothetical protein